MTSTPHSTTMNTRITLHAFSSVLIACTSLLVGCDSSSKDHKKPLAVKPLVTRDVPSVLRGTVGTEVTVSGTQPVLISGYGFVVGLNGTGGGPLPEPVAANMERQMGLMGIGRAEQYQGYAISGRSPRELLRDKNTAVVLVQAAIAPGTPAGARFDVFITAQNATSLEGGRLWTTELQVGNAALVGGVQTRKIAEAAGPIFINPFVQPDQESAGVTRFAGRILDGGVVQKPFALELHLDNQSHMRAMSIQDAIRERIPRGAGDLGEVARGRNDALIELNVPRRFSKSPMDFLALALAVTIDQYAPPEELAKRYADAARAQPALAPMMSRCLEALGRPERTLPLIRELYDSNEPVVQMAGLKAGANLGDVRAASHLQRLAKEADSETRQTAIDLLTKIGGGPTIDLTLRDLLSDRDLAIRISAYEALMKRAVRVQTNRLAEQNAHVPTSQLEVLAEADVPPGLLQGVSRRLIAGKFLLDIVPFGDPLIYITQQGQPRVVLFGDNLLLPRPMFAGMWSNRLLLAADGAAEPVRIRFEDVAGYTRTASVKGGFPELIETLASDPVPEDPKPVIGLSYAEIVGAIYELQQQHIINAPFTTERDRLSARIYAARDSDTSERPETSDDKPKVVIVNEGGPGNRPVAKPTDQAPKKVPIQQQPPK
jgi:hypothetical protein